MRKLMLAAVSLAVMTSCGDKKKDYAIVSGTVQNANGNQIEIYDLDGEKVSTYNLDANGSFRDTIHNPQGNYTLTSAGVYAPIYLDKDYDLQINFDASNFDESLSYDGKGKEANQYLKGKMKKAADFRSSLRELFAKKEDEFLNDVDAYKASLEEGLKDLNDKDFVAQEKKSIDYLILLQKANYERIHQMLTQNPEFKVSDNYPDVLKGVDLNDNEEYKKNPSYRELVMSQLFNECQKEVAETEKSMEEVTMQKAESMKSGAIRDALLMVISSQILPRYSEETKAQYEKIQSLLSEEKNKKEFEKQISEFKKLEKGNASPKFVGLENYDGSVTSLDDFKGKIVYVDVWATWCPPCRAEIPHLKNLEKAYHNNKDIVFVSISVDKESDKDKWKKMIEDEQMGGVQLIESKDNNQFTQGYNVNGIPRFILIGKDGEIINADAPRPSETDAITALFEENGIKK